MPSIDSGDTTFVLLSAALVLLMTPGLAFFYAGLVRRKNALNTLMMSFVAMGVVGVVWMLAGYSLAFSTGPEGLDAFIGGLGYLGLSGVGADPHPALVESVPHSAFMLFQGMFAVITPALISGAVAERMRFRSFVVFCALWSLAVYAPVAHWVWAPGGWLRALGALDFAGGTVVHINAGVAALVAAVVVGRRRGFPRTAIRPHNVPFVLLGTGLLWFGWMGFNGGSALGAHGLAAAAYVTTFAAAAAASLAWVVLEQWRHGKMTGVGFASGAVAGLVAITPAAGFITPMAAMALGAAAAAVSLAAVGLKTKLGLDDALDVFGIHGVSGLLGALGTGALASLAVNPGGADGSLALVGKQALACLATVAYSGALSFGLLKLIERTMGLRVDAAAEDEGTDLSEHGESAYVDGDGTSHPAPGLPGGKSAPLVAPVRQHA